VRKSRLVALVCLALFAWSAGLAIGLAGPDIAGTPRPIRVSGSSPFAACVADGPGISYVDAAVEPWVAVNPTAGGSAANVVAVWQQDRWSNMGARGLVAGYSFDGGSRWAQTPLPFSACAPGGLPFPRATDPWVSFGPDGTAYAVAISLSVPGPDLLPNDSAVAAATSTDGGRTWRNLRVIGADRGTSQFFNDKATVTADPARPGVAYVIWQRLDASDPGFFTVAAWLSETEDGGGSWSEPRVVARPGPYNEAFGNRILIDPRTGTLYNVFNWIIRSGVRPSPEHENNVAFQKSTDGGETWSEPLIITPLQTVGVVDSGTGAAVRTASRIPSPAIDGRTGRLYVAWQDARLNAGQYDEILICSSDDGGASWTPPVRVSASNGGAAFVPSLSIGRAGLLGATYYAFRSPAAETEGSLTDYWLTVSADDGASFGDAIRLGQPFDLRAAPDAGGYFVGEYQGLAGLDSGFLAVFVQNRPGREPVHTDIVATTIRPQLVRWGGWPAWLGDARGRRVP